MSRRHVTYTTVPGATVRVMRAGGSVKETLYAGSSGATQVANPMTAGQDGTVSAYVEGSDLVDLLVVAPAADPYSVTDVFVGSAGGGGGGAPAGGPIVRAFPFAFDTPDLLTGAALYTPTLGDVLLDAWVEIATAWNGTSPTLDIGTFVDGSNGLYSRTAYGSFVLTMADTVAANGEGYLANAFAANLQATSSSLRDVGLVSLIIGSFQKDPDSDLFVRQPGYQGGERLLPTSFVTTHPIKVVVSQDGTPTGDDPGSTQGAATLYLVTASPA